jgi:hypothetical protein
LLLFGAIIQWFARYELLMQQIMAKVAGSDTAAIILLTAGLDFTGKRQALLDLMRHRAVPLDQYDRIYDYLTPPHTLTPLRNDIAHAAWIPGPVHDAIQPDWILRLPPSIKPWRSDAEGPSDKFIERDEDKNIYTLDDLGAVVETLAENHALFLDYLRKSGLFPEVTVEN